MSLKWIAFAALFVVAVIWREPAMLLLGTVGIGTLVCFLVGFVYQSVAPIGKWFVPHGAIAIGLLILLSVIPGPGPVGWMVETEVPPWHLWLLEHRWQMGVVAFAASIGMLTAITMLARRATIIETATDPKVARALIRQGRFHGYRVKEGNDYLAMDSAGAVSGPADLVPPPTPAKPAPMVADASGRKQPLPSAWVDVAIPPHVSLDDVLGSLLDAGIAEMEPLPPAAIRVRAADALRVQGLVAQAAAAQPAHTP